jgi:uncharacterized surface protein with fasciclin (FAS1) repeats
MFSSPPTVGVAEGRFHGALPYGHNTPYRAAARRLRWLSYQTHIIMNKHLLPLLVLASATAAGLSLPAAVVAQVPSSPASAPDIVAVASSDADFSTLVSALRAADLVGALKGKGPFTVFAPNNAAFAKLPPRALEDLLKPENKKKLAAILKNHVIEGKVMAADVKSGTVRTLDGKKVEVAVENGKVGFGGAQVIATDIKASNGVIHIIDTVVMPD